MRDFQDSFEIRKRSFISAFSICMTVRLLIDYQEQNKANAGMSEQIVKQNARIQKPFSQRNKLFTP